MSRTRMHALGLFRSRFHTSPYLTAVNQIKLPGDGLDEAPRSEHPGGPCHEQSELNPVSSSPGTLGACLDHQIIC
jgi:hypothetical protein